MKKTIEGFREVQTVWCPPVKKMVSLKFCLTGGPSRSDRKCEYFRGVRTQNKRTILTHVIPTEKEELVTGSVIEEEADGTDLYI